MDPNKSASAPPSDLSGEKSNLGHAAPPPYQENTTTWSPQPSPGYPPQPQGYGAPPFQYQGQGYEQQMHPSHTVIVQPKHYVIPAPLENPVDDHLWYSVFTLLCCCLPLGVAALIYSISTREANHVGDRMTAERTSRISRTLNHVALGLGIGSIILIIVFTFVMGSLIDN